MLLLMCQIENRITIAYTNHFSKFKWLIGLLLSSNCIDHRLFCVSWLHCYRNRCWHVVVIIVFDILVDDQENRLYIVKINIFSKSRSLVGVLLSSLRRNHLCFSIHSFYCCRNRSWRCHCRCCFCC